MIDAFKPVVGLLAAAAALAGAGSAAAATTLLYTVDENGAATVKDFKGTFPIPLDHLDDPGPGGLAGAPGYFLQGPANMVTGDLVLLENGGATSDIVRFNDYQTGHPTYPQELVFYSGSDDGVDSLTDVGFPGALWPTVVRLFEVGPEGQNGVLYHPGAGEPGFMSGYDVTYRIISDGVAPVPEPGTWVMLLIGCGALGALARRRPSRVRPAV
jgi:hypothetical protein